jgi:hypothetical protein
MRASAICALILSAGTSACHRATQLPWLLAEPGQIVGNFWDLCDNHKQNQEPADARHATGIVARLHSRFPPGSPRENLERELVSEGFRVERCDSDPTIWTATYRWEGNWGGQGLITYKADERNRLKWATGDISYTGP